MLRERHHLLLVGIGDGTPAAQRLWIGGTAAVSDTVSMRAGYSTLPSKYGNRTTALDSTLFVAQSAVPSSAEFNKIKVNM